MDSLATPTLCPSAHQSFADTKRNVTCSSNGQRKQRADPRLPICSNWQWECRWVGMMLMSPAAGKGQWASEFVRKKLSKCWTLLTAGSVTTHRLGHQDKTLPKAQRTRGLIFYHKLLPPLSNTPFFPFDKEMDRSFEFFIQYHKVNRCLARYNPRATTINRPTNRAPNKPAWPGPNWPKMPILGQIWSFLGKKSFFLLEKS